MTMTPELAGGMTQRQPGRVALTSTSWLPGGKLDLRDWVAQGRRLGSVGRAAPWWIGDWLRYGNLKFGERYTRAARITGYDAQTLMNMVYVASAFEVSERRANLSWSHHAEVAALNPEARAEWLDRAEANRLSVRCLRDEMRRDRLARANAEAGSDDRERSDAEPSAAAAAAAAIQCPKCGCRIEQAEAVDARDEHSAPGGAALAAGTG